LPPYGACDLGSINLTQFIEQPFTERARLDTTALAKTVVTAVSTDDEDRSVMVFAQFVFSTMSSMCRLSAAAASRKRVRLAADRSWHHQIGWPTLSSWWDCPIAASAP
jgi:hypothetical protein